MNDLLLDSLEVHNFRAFQTLKIEQLGRVNLIVGKNSVGKTSLLESLWVYANQGSFTSIREILSARNEYKVRNSKKFNTSDEEETLANTIKYLFNGRKELQHLPENIKIGSIKQADKTLTLGVGWYIVEEEEGVSRLKPVNSEDKIILDDAIMGLAIKFNGQTARIIRLNRDSYLRTENDISSNNFVRANGLSESEISSFWSKITLTELEDDVIEALRIIIPDIERVAVLADTSAIRDNYSVIAKIRGTDSRIPLRSLGDGISRIFGITLALVNSKNGILLVDEIENGLHYTVQLELWRLILKIAGRLNVQVFSTTHNWDCIEAFQQASMENQQEQGMLIRLDNRDGAVVPTLYDERRLNIATREQLEVR